MIELAVNTITNIYYKYVQGAKIFKRKLEHHEEWNFQTADVTKNEANLRQSQTRGQ